MKLSFSTLGCPAWTWNHIVDEAARLGYDGVELRGIAGELRLSRCEALCGEQLDNSLAYAKQRGVSIVCLDTSCLFHDESRFDAAMEEGLETIDLAVKMNVPYIRVFGDAVPAGTDTAIIASQVARGLQLLGEYAEGKGIGVLLETHGDFSTSERVLGVLRQTTSPVIGVIWDVHHTILFGKESPDYTWLQLAPYIRHAHIKDTRIVGDKVQPALVGEGDLPLPAWIALLQDKGYAGWLSFEWEKMWHPDIEEPELALPAFIHYISSIADIS